MMSEILTSQVMEVEDKSNLNYLTNKEVNILIMKQTKKIRILHFVMSKEIVGKCFVKVHSVVLAFHPAGARAPVPKKD
jgi:hypothetical protein